MIVVRYLLFLAIVVPEAMLRGMEIAPTQISSSNETAPLEEIDNVEKLSQFIGKVVAYTTTAPSLLPSGELPLPHHAPFHYASISWYSSYNDFKNPYGSDDEQEEEKGWSLHPLIHADDAITKNTLITPQKLIIASLYMRPITVEECWYLCDAFEKKKVMFASRSFSTKNAITFVLKSLSRRERRMYVWYYLPSLKLIRLAHRFDTKSLWHRLPKPLFIQICRFVVEKKIKEEEITPV